MSNNTTLDGYISMLMHDDNALKKFLADPTNGGQEYGITKAQRAVLRRVLANLSNKSKNGYGIERDLGSYRRSLRLLQNVLHSHGAAHTMLTASADGLETFSFHVYITGDPKNPGAPYDNPSLAYTNYVTFSKSGSYTTIGQAMNFNAPASPTVNQKVTVNLGAASDSAGNSGNISYTAIYLGIGGSTTEFDWYIESFTLSDFSSNINGTYDLPLSGATGTDRFPFWFFSLNGEAISPNSNQGYSLTPGVVEGDDGEGFNNFPLNGSHYIVWQPIAPDMDYGFGPCFQTPYTPIVLGIPILEKDVVNVGQPFYSNIVNNVIVPKDATEVLLSLNPDGTGNIRTDDTVTIEFKGTSNSYTYFMDYSNNCSGTITPTGPVDILSELGSNDLLGDNLTVTITYSDKCGGKISSSGYFLVAIK